LVHGSPSPPSRLLGDRSAVSRLQVPRPSAITAFATIFECLGDPGRGLQELSGLFVGFEQRVHGPEQIEIVSAGFSEKALSLLGAFFESLVKKLGDPLPVVQAHFCSTYS